MKKIVASWVGLEKGKGAKTERYYNIFYSRKQPISCKHKIQASRSTDSDVAQEKKARSRRRVIVMMKLI